MVVELNDPVVGIPVPVVIVLVSLPVVDPVVLVVGGSGCTSSNKNIQQKKN